MQSTIDSINQLLRSYENFRAGVLRQMGFDAMIKAEFQRVSGRPGASQPARQRNPCLWEPSDIHAFAHRLNQADRQTHRLADLTGLIDQLPEQERMKLRRSINLSLVQLNERRSEPATWRAGELKRLSFYLSRFR